MTELEIRPNIRIEINNTSDGPAAMEIDEENDKSEEEGEIREIRVESSKQNVNSIDTIMDDIIPEIDHRKLEERAKRFALKPDEIKTFTETDLNSLYASLGITAENAEQIRIEAVHVRSSNKMRVEHVVNYFKAYSPTYVEWVDDESFNLVWKDKFLAARACFHLSQPIKGMPVRVASELNIDFVDEQEAQEKGMFNTNRVVELQEETNEIFGNCIDISVVNIPIPPGYWRLGTKDIESNSVLLRFSMKIDKKPYLVEKCSKYYNSGTSNHRGIFARNKEIADKNPWGFLAETWDEDSKFREKERVNFKKIPALSTDSLPIVVESELRSKLTAKRRLAAKIDQPEPGIEEDESDEENNAKTSSKIPRMRMYADEEEEKIKKKKLLRTLMKQSEILKKTEIPNSDLRNMLRVNKRPPVVEHLDDKADLSISLKNRSRNLVFTVSQDKKDVRSRLADRVEKRRSPKMPISPIRFSERSSDDFRYERSSRKSDARHHRRSRSPNKRFEGRMYSEDPEYSTTKPRSKVALVIKTQKKPSVASAIQSRKFRTSRSSSSEDSDSSSSSSTSSSSSGGSTLQNSDKKTKQVRKF